MDTASHVDICVTQRFRAPAERVFDAWLDPETAGRWLFATAWHPLSRVRINARVGGSFSLVERRDGEDIEHAGEYVEITRPRRLLFTLSVGRHPPVITRVTAEIVPLGSGCEINLTQENVPVDRAGGIEARWTGILYGLDVTLGRRARRHRGAGPGRDGQSAANLNHTTG